MQDQENQLYPARQVRSFVRREGRLTTAQQNALTELLPKYGLPLQSEAALQLTDVFQNDLPLLLEIGFGNGESLLAQALANPQQNHIGLEVHRPGVGHLLQQLERLQLANVRVAVTDATFWTRATLASACISTVQIFFPDPWPKKRHHKRRLIQPIFVAELARIIRPGGALMLATDWRDYAEQMLAVMSNQSGFTNLAGPGQYSERPLCRPLTRFERRGQRLGHRVFDLHFQRLQTGG
ncbi:MAG: tRNA (guanosine(46)-N7)-methyltransferase TrmB [Gammaproteobacteria bacterium]|jgi:tRNA (guanine-N7-)-methyltransferase|nr:tRNA (guanosine(46)-N7)-methyltransferase TrmB [Gammaproteobacteria bacterium]